MKEKVIRFYNDHVAIYDQEEEDWEQMNCLNFVFVPKTIGSKELLDQLYNEQVKRFYTSKAWQGKFRKRIWQHRHSIWHIIKNLPDFLTAKSQFEPKEKKMS